MAVSLDMKTTSFHNYLPTSFFPKVQARLRSILSDMLPAYVVGVDGDWARGLQSQLGLPPHMLQLCTLPSSGSSGPEPRTGVALGFMRVNGC